MKERPILFSGPMVRAILSGAKSQTRRALKPQPANYPALRPEPRLGSNWVFMAYSDQPRYAFATGDVRCPYGQPGDRLWVKETTINVEDQGWVGPVYVESDEGRQALEWGWGESDDPDHIPPHAIKRRSPLFMRRSASRITLEITDVRVERLQDISEADAMAEGVDALPMETRRATPRCDFMALWESINGRGSWEANPFCWVLGFRRL